MNERARELRWNCVADGCFNEKHRLKFAAFDGCFPGRIQFTDVDALVEICGRALLLEWKSTVGEIPVGQRILFERLTAEGKFCVLVIAGDASQMKPTHWRRFEWGRGGRWEECDMPIIRGFLEMWSDYARFGSPHAAAAGAE